MRRAQRKPDQMRPVRITPDFISQASGSALIEVGRTRVICTASIESGVPNWMRGGGKGWITAEYSMLPASTNTRSQRESSRGRISGRTHEIQRLIGRSLRAVTPMELIGARTASITGAFVALYRAFDALVKTGNLAKVPLTDYVAAASVGIIGGVPMLDLCYEEDSSAEVD